MWCFANVTGAIKLATWSVQGKKSDFKSLRGCSPKRFSWTRGQTACNRGQKKGKSKSPGVVGKRYGAMSQCTTQGEESLLREERKR